MKWRTKNESQFSMLDDYGIITYCNFYKISPPSHEIVMLIKYLQSLATEIYHEVNPVNDGFKVVDDSRDDTYGFTIRCKGTCTDLVMVLYNKDGFTVKYLGSNWSKSDFHDNDEVTELVRKAINVLQNSKN